VSLIAGTDTPAAAVRGVELDVVELDELQKWLPQRPNVRVTAGASTATLTSRDDEGVIRTTVVDPQPLIAGESLFLHGHHEDALGPARIEPPLHFDGCDRLSCDPLATALV
jgi:hypothetical protein